MAIAAATVGDLQLLSAFLICQDEETYLGDCIESLRGVGDIVVVDSGSTDGTLALIESYIALGWPIRLFREKWRGYAAQKQFALEQCRGDWCINIDSDERIDTVLRDELPRLMAADDTVAGWRIARRNYLVGFGYTPPGVHERPNLRLIRRGRGSYDLTQKVHEGIKPDGRVVDSLKGSLMHFRPLTMEEQILKENKYSSLKADQKVAERGRPRPLRLVFNPPLYFLRLYFGGGLWRCGIPGFIEAMTGAVYSFMTEAKIFQRVALRDMPAVDPLHAGSSGRPGS